MYNNNKLTRAVRSALYCGMVASVGSFSAFAQEANTEDSVDELEKIVVTARRKEETLIEIPMAVSSISAAEIEDANYTDARDIFRTLAGAAMPRGELILRGLSGGNDTTPETTATFVDDVPFTFNNLSDVERVEVLRGPQGTLYGSNAIGGTVRIITKKPVLDEFELFGSMQGGVEKDVDGVDTNVSLGINIPLVEGKSAMRINGNVENDPSPMVNINTGQQAEIDRSFLRSQFLYQVNDDFNIRLGFAHIKYDDKGEFLGDRSKPGYFYDYTLTENADAPYGYDVDFYTVDCAPEAERPACKQGEAYRHNGNIPERYQVWESIDAWTDITDNLYTINMDHENLGDFATMTYAGSYRKNTEKSLDNWTRLDADDMFLTWIINDQEYEETTHEVRFQNIDPKNPLSWTVGAFYNKELIEDQPDWQNQYHEGGDKAAAIAMNWWWGIDVTALGEETFGNPQNNWNFGYIKDYYREFAMFADVAYTFDLGDNGELELNGGIRNFDLKDNTIYEDAGIWTTFYGPWTTDRTELGGEESGNRLKFSASWRPSDTMSVYALYSEGYRPGGNNGPLAGSCVDDPKAKDRKKRYTSDSIENYELGLKASVLEGKFQFAAAVYQIDWSDIKTSIYMDTCGFSYTANAGEAVSKGFEFESSAWLTDDLQMHFNTSYTSSEVTKDNDAIGAKAGDDMTMVPEWNAYLAFDQETQMFGKTVNFRADYTYYGEYKTHFNTRDEDKVPSYSYVNFSGRVQVTDDVKLSVHLKNVLDDDSIKYMRARSRSESNTTAQQYIDYLPGRNITLRLDYIFF